MTALRRHEPKGCYAMYVLHIHADPGLPRPPGFVLRSDSGVADLTRTFGSGIGLSALSQRLRSRRYHLCAAPRAATHARSRLFSLQAADLHARKQSTTMAHDLQGSPWHSRACVFLSDSLTRAAMVIVGNGQSLEHRRDCPTRSDVASVDGLSLGGGGLGGGLSPALSPLPNALNSFFGNLQNQVLIPGQAPALIEHSLKAACRVGHRPPDSPCRSTYL